MVFLKVNLFIPFVPRVSQQRSATRRHVRLPSSVPRCLMFFTTCISAARKGQRSASAPLSRMPDLFGFSSSSRADDPRHRLRRRHGDHRNKPRCFSKSRDTRYCHFQLGDTIRHVMRKFWQNKSVLCNNAINSIFSVYNNM